MPAQTKDLDRYCSLVMKTLRRYLMTGSLVGLFDVALECFFLNIFCLLSPSFCFSCKNCSARMP